MAGFTGGCLCGQIRYEVTGEPVRAQICHCDDCRRSSGSDSLLNVFVMADDFRVTQGEPKTFQHTANSGNIRFKAFCDNCGSQVYSWGALRPEQRGIKAGTIDDASFVRPWAHVWIKRALPCSNLNDDLQKFEENAKL